MPIRDLGVFFTPDLKFNQHIELIISKANRISFALLKSLKSKDPKFLINMFNTYVRSVLEFASPIWNPYTKTHISKIERIQKRFFRSVFLRLRYPLIENIPNYKELLKMFMAESLASRRCKADLKLFHKNIWGHVKIKHNNSFFFQKSTTRGDQFKLRTINCSTMVRFNSFFIRTARWYTKLPSELKLNDPSNFAKLLDSYDVSFIFGDL